MSVSHIIVLGSINTDLVIRGPRLPRPGETVLGGEFYQASGGKGANQAVAAARLASRPVVLLAAVGDDPLGREAWQRLQQENLDLGCVRTVSERPSGVALILVDRAGENCISVAPGANQALRAEDVDRVPSALFKQAGVVLASLEVPWGFVSRGLERGRAAGATTILNPAPASPELVESNCLGFVDVITPNETEAESLTGVQVVDESTASEAGRRLQALGCKSAIVTRGGAGCVVIERDAKVIEAPQVVAVDTTAAGDAFNGALAVALSEGLSLVESARWASRVGAISVTRAGAQPSLPRREEVDATLL